MVENEFEKALKRKLNWRKVMHTSAETVGIPDGSVVILRPEGWGNAAEMSSSVLLVEWDDSGPLWRHLATGKGFEATCVQAAVSS